MIDPHRGVVNEAWSLDYPLHDLAGIILDGDAGKKELPVYSSAFDDLNPVGAPAGLASIERNLAQDAALGYRDFKLKLGRGHRWMPRAEGLAHDIEVTGSHGNASQTPASW